MPYTGEGGGAYRPSGWLLNPHAQTIYAALLGRLLSTPPLRRFRWDTPDGDFIDVDCLDGSPAAPLVVLFHGLEGGSRSHYAKAMVREAKRRHWRLAIPHFRGCSGEPNRLARAYHSGDSAEIDWVLRRMHCEMVEDGRPMFAAGISLGGNALLKWLGERGSESRLRIHAAAAISAPMDLMMAGDALAKGFNRVYSRMFLRTLKKTAEYKARVFPGTFDAQAMRLARTLREFDNAVTAPLHGFRDTDDYWTRSSSRAMLSSIQCPTYVLNARDDPFLPASALPDLPNEVVTRDGCQSDAMVGFMQARSAVMTLEFPRAGGHVGFVTGRFPGEITWMPRRVFDFFTRHVVRREETR